MTETIILILAVLVGSPILALIVFAWAAKSWF
jgi:hypothetical protein